MFSGNDQIALENVQVYDKIILSPGPGIPSEAGLLLPLIKQYAASKSILGVCLGHQAIGEAFGGNLVDLSAVFSWCSQSGPYHSSGIRAIPQPMRICSTD